MKFEISPQMFEKYSNIKIHENPSVGAKLFQVERWTGGQTRGNDEANSSYSKFCERY